MALTRTAWANRGRAALLWLGPLPVLALCLWSAGYRTSAASCLALDLQSTPYESGRIAARSPFPGGQVVVAKAGDIFHLVLLRRQWGLCSVRGDQLGVHIPVQSSVATLGAYARIGEDLVTALTVVVQDPRIRTLTHPASQQTLSVREPGLYTILVVGPYRNQSLEISALDQSGIEIARCTAWQPVAP